MKNTKAVQSQKLFNWWSLHASGIMCFCESFWSSMCTYIYDIMYIITSKHTCIHCIEFHVIALHCREKVRYITDGVGYVTYGISDISCIYHVYIMYISCIYHVYIMYISCIYHVYIMSISCLYHVYILYISCIYHVYIMYISCIYHVYIMCISCIYHVYIMCISCIYHVYIMYISCIYHVYIMCIYIYIGLNRIK